MSFPKAERVQNIGWVAFAQILGFDEVKGHLYAVQLAVYLSKVEKARWVVKRATQRGYWLVEREGRREEAKP